MELAHVVSMDREFLVSAFPCCTITLFAFSIPFFFSFDPGRNIEEVLLGNRLFIETVKFSRREFRKSFGNIHVHVLAIITMCLKILQASHVQNVLH